MLLTLLSTPLFGAGGREELLYIVNGEVAEEGFDTSSQYVDKIEMIRGEEAVERYGLRGSNGVVLVTLKFDELPIFSEKESLRHYISSRIKWKDEYTRAEVIFKYRVDTSGRMTITEILHSSNKKLLGRVKKEVEELPLWLSPAKNMGVAVESSGTERITLPYKK